MDNKIAHNVCELIGETPMVFLNKVNHECKAHLAIKLESNNPCSSVKDRIAKSMIENAEKEGIINAKTTTIIEPTSGNTGIGLAMIAAQKGYKIKLVMPENMSKERRIIMLAFGADIILTPKEFGMEGAVNKAKQIIESGTNYWMPQQFSNPFNPLAHFTTTGPEIWNDTNGNIDCLVSGVGTGGTIMGCSKFFKTKGKNVYTVAVEPEESAVLSGGPKNPHKIQGIGAGFIPEIYDKNLVDEVVKVSSEEAFKMTRKLIREEGLFLGISSGAAVCAGLNIASRDEFQGKLIVIIAPSFGERYLSTGLFNEEVGKAETLPINNPYEA